MSDNSVNKKEKGLLLGVLMVFLLILLIPAGADAAAKPKAPVSTWSIPEYGEKAYNTVTGAMAAYDPLSPDAPGLDATAAVLMDAKSGMILYELDPDGMRYPASMTKLVTLLVALDAVDSGEAALTDTVTFSEAAVALDGTRTGYLAGTTDTLQHTLEMMMVFSANDAAYAVGEFIGGSIENFAALMNAKGAELGMTNSHFVNPNGLHDPNHWTTARDMAVLSRYCVQQEKVLAFTSLQSVGMPDGRMVYNTNKLLFWTEGADGLKTGTTTMAGHCLAATAQRNGMRLIAVTMGSQKDYTHYIDAMKLLEYGYANYAMLTPVTAGEIMGETEVLYGKEETVKLAAASDISFPVRNGETATPEIVVEPNSAVEGPADAGIDGGDVSVKVNGAEVGHCDLVTTEKIHKRGVILWLKDFFAALIEGV